MAVRQFQQHQLVAIHAPQPGDLAGLDHAHEFGADAHLRRHAHAQGDVIVLQVLLKRAGRQAQAFAGVGVAPDVDVRGEDGVGDAVGNRQPCHGEG